MPTWSFSQETSRARVSLRRGLWASISQCSMSSAITSSMAAASTAPPTNSSVFVPARHVRVLDDDEIVIDGVRFLGSTLWTDFMLFGGGDHRGAAMVEARNFMRDFSRIRTAEASSEFFTPEDSAALFTRHADWLDRQLAVPHAGPTVVITHHAPSRHSIHPRFADSLLNACFVSDAEHLLGTDSAQLWIHGHTHDSFDYAVHGTRVVCNPRGYAKAGMNENPRFDPDLMIEVVTA